MTNRENKPTSSFQFIKQFTKQSDYWSLCLPRIYKKAGKFGDPSMPAATLVVTIEAVRSGFSQPTRINHVAAKLLEFQIPTMFIERESASSAMASVPPSDLRWADIPLTFESALLMLPKNWLNHPIHGATDFIRYAKFKAGEVFVPVGSKQPSKFKEDTFIIFTSYGHAPEFPSADTSLRVGKQSTLADIGYSPEEIFFSRDTQNPFELYLPESEFKFTEQITRLLFSILLAITERPSLLKRGIRGGRHKKSGMPIWTPNIVGRDYRASYQLSG